VYVSGGTFKKTPAGGTTTSGIIYGWDVTTGENMAQRGGHAVYAEIGKKRDNTLGEGDTLDSSGTSGWD
jgi:hypothetical protein